MNIILDYFKEKIVIVGCGDFAREVADVAIDNGLKVVGFIGNSPMDYRGIKTLCDDKEYLIGYRYIPYLIGIGDPTIRTMIDIQYTLDGAKPFTLISKRAHILGDEVIINRGCIIQPGVVLTNRIKLDSHVILNLNTTIGHDVKIGSYSNLSPGCHINGHTLIGKRCNLGSGTVTVPGATISSMVTTGAGAVVKGIIPIGQTVVGIPAKPIEKKQ